MSETTFPQPQSTASDWRELDFDGEAVWVHKTTGGSVKSTPGGWRYRIGSGDWSEIMPNLGVAMYKAMDGDDGWEIMR